MTRSRSEIVADLALIDAVSGLAALPALCRLAEDARAALWQPMQGARTGLYLDLACTQCGTRWPFDASGPQRCPDCLDHLGEALS